MNLAARGQFCGIVGNEILRVVYSDESGTGDDTQPITVVTAILLNVDSQWTPIERELSALKARISQKLLRGSKDSGTGSPYFAIGAHERELKGSHLFKGIRGKVHGVSRSEAAKALAEVLAVAVRNSVQIFHGAIDRSGRINWNRKSGFSDDLETDQEAAFSECLRRLDGFVHTYMPKERVLWIADKSGFEASLKHGLAFWQWVAGASTGRLFQLIQTAFGDGSNGVIDDSITVEDTAISQVVDTIYFGNSHESLALQLADVCSATISQYLLGKEDAKLFYDLLRRQVITDASPILYSPAWGGDTCKP
jgi:hypothetical protein